MKAILKFLFYLFLFLLVTGCIVASIFIPSLKLPAIVILVIILLIVCYFAIIRKLLIRKKEKAFVERVIRTDKQAIKKAPAAHQAVLEGLQKKWMDAINRLRTSKLRQSGNPLYVLPWYLFIGESGTGKTSSIINSGLSSPLSDLNTTQALAVTRNCDWWFFNEAVILDTAGRYTVPLDQDRDTAEWNEFLSLLAKFRKREPLNGIIASVAADSLLNATSDELIAVGKQIRSRVDQVMQVLGSGFPIYLMITKLDLVFGMAEFFRALPPSHLGQAMGWSNMEKATYSDQLLDKALATIQENLKDLQFRLLNSGQSPEPEILIFPDRLAELSPGLHTFCKTLFVDSVYLETPLFRGVYFSSALQKVSPDLPENATADPAAKHIAGGMFLRDFFGRILPSDRNLYWPTVQYTLRQLKTKWTVFGGWALFWVFLFMLVWMGYRRNHRILQWTQSSEISASGQVAAVEKLREKLLFLKKENHRILPFLMGLRQSRRVEKQLHQQFLETFEKQVYRPLETTVDSSIQKSDSTIPEELVMQAVRYLTAQLGLLRNPDPENQSYLAYRAAALEYIPVIQPALSLAEIELVVRQYCDWLRWQDKEYDTEKATTEKQIYRRLAALLEHKGANLQWCTRYPIHGIDGITLQNFWPYVTEFGRRKQVASVTIRQLNVRASPSAGAAIIGAAKTGTQYTVESETDKWIRIKTESGKYGWISRKYSRINQENMAIRIEGAYTAEARKRIESFLAHIDSAITDPAAKNAFAYQRNIFHRWYTGQFYRRWRTFTAHFYEGLLHTQELSRFKTLTTAIAERADPFSQFLDRLQQELSAIESTEQRPSWVVQTLMLTVVEKRAHELLALDSTTSVIQKKTKEGISFFKNIGKKAKETVDTEASSRSRLIEAAARDWIDFDKTLTEALTAVTQRGGASHLAQGLFNQASDAATEYRLADGAGMALKKRLFGARADELLWDIVIGPLAILRGLAYRQAGTDLQHLWERSVLVPLRRSSTDEQIDQLFAPETGLVRKLLQDTAVTPFIQSTLDGGLQPVTGPEGPLPFTNEFLNFINQGIRYNKRNEYVVTLQAIPFTVNAEAQETPHQTILRLQCAEDATVLENFNYHQTADFLYRPDNCGDVSLKIIFPSFMVSQTWPGRLGFPLFLKQFKDGSYNFTIDDFDPQYQALLRRKNVQWISIVYDIDQKAATEVFALLNAIPDELPTLIIDWETMR